MILTVLLMVATLILSNVLFYLWKHCLHVFIIIGIEFIFESRIFDAIISAFNYNYKCIFDVFYRLYTFYI